MKLIEIYKTLNKNNKGLFESPSLLEYTFMQDYLTNELCKHIDKSIIRKFANREFISLEDTEDTIEQEWLECVNGYIVSQRYNLEQLWTMLHTQYNPLYNYDKISEIETTKVGTTSEKTGTVTRTIDKTGTETDTNTESGSITDTNIESGSISDITTRTGTESDSANRSGNNGGTTTIGELVVNVENKDNPWNSPSTTVANGSSTSTSEEQTNSEHGEFTETNTNTHTYSNVKDEKSTTYNAHTNEKNVTYNAHKNENVHTFTNRKDTDKIVYDMSDAQSITENTIENTHGNIGTLTSSQMLMQEYDARWKVDFYNDLFTRIIFELTY